MRFLISKKSAETVDSSSSFFDSSALFSYSSIDSSILIKYIYALPHAFLATKFNPLIFTSVLSVYESHNDHRISSIRNRIDTLVVNQDFFGTYSPSARSAICRFTQTTNLIVVLHSCVKRKTLFCTNVLICELVIGSRSSPRVSTQIRTRATRRWSLSSKESLIHNESINTISYRSYSMIVMRLTRTTNLLVKSFNQMWEGIKILLKRLNQKNMALE